MASIDGWVTNYDITPQPAHVRIIERLRHLNTQASAVSGDGGGGVDAWIARRGWAARTCAEICDRIVGTKFMHSAVTELVQELELHAATYEEHKVTVAKTIDWLRRNYSV